MKLDMNILPKYIFSGVRQFFPKEKHINRTFEEDVLILMYKGILKFNEAGVNIELSPGEYYFQIKNKKQKGIKESLTPNYFYIHFDGSFSPIGHLPIRGEFDIEKMRPLINELQNLPLNSTSLERQKCFYAILTELLKNEKTNKIAEQIHTYIQENYNKKISIEQLERIFFISKNQITTIFKESYEITPHKYITELRLLEACKLLLSTNRSLSTIANNVGYNDYSIFYKAFYAKFQISPKEYRMLSNKNKSITIGKEPD